MKVLVFIAWLVSHEVCARYNISLVWWEKTPKTKNILLKRALSFDQWKKYSENYQPIRDRLRLVYKFTENYCRLRLFSKFIQTQKRYPTSLDKIRILAWKFFLWTKPLKNLILTKYLIYVAAPFNCLIVKSTETI